LFFVSFLLLGCSSLTVNHDFDPDADFAAYRTYAWASQSQSSSEAGASDLVMQRVRRAVDAELQKEGLSRVEAEPDLLVASHTGVKDKINVTDWGYTYGDYYWGWGGRQIDVYQYQQGTLVVDLIDYGSKELVWRGWAQKTLDENPTPERMDRTIQDAVKKIFERYPPK
jgi:hypothetical protein